MEALTATSSTKIIRSGGGYGSKSLSLMSATKSRDLSFMGVNTFTNLCLPISFKPRTVQSIVSSQLSSFEVPSTMETQNTPMESTETTSKNVRVKFQLQKQCSYGDNFFLVGDDPMMGLWSPFNGLPMNWSDGHIWTVEMDLPVGMPVRFKYVLRRTSGEVMWQPGPDRVFHTWDTKNTITVDEDWENQNMTKIKEDPPTGGDFIEELASINKEELILSSYNQEPTGKEIGGEYGGAWDCSVPNNRIEVGDHHEEGPALVPGFTN